MAAPPCPIWRRHPPAKAPTFFVFNSSQVRMPAPPKLMSSFALSHSPSCCAASVATFASEE